MGDAWRVSRPGFFVSLRLVLNHVLLPSKRRITHSGFAGLEMSQSHKVTESQSHRVTGGGGGVTSVTEG